MHDDLVKFLSSVLNDDGNIPTNLVNLIPENGKVKIKCAMCGEDCKNHKGATDHLLYKCKVSVYKKEEKGNQTGGGFRYTEETYAIPQIFTTQDLHRKAFEIVGYYANEGATREELLEILREYARVNRQRIRKRELEMYLRAVIGQQQHARLIAVYKNNPQTLQLLQYVRQLQMELINCQNIIRQLQNNSQYIGAKINHNNGVIDQLKQASDSINSSVKSAQDIGDKLRNELNDCNEELRKLREKIDLIRQEFKGKDEPADLEKIAKILEINYNIQKGFNEINPLGNIEVDKAVRKAIFENNESLQRIEKQLAEINFKIDEVKGKLGNGNNTPGVQLDLTSELNRLESHRTFLQNQGENLQRMIQGLEKLLNDVIKSQEENRKLLGQLQKSQLEVQSLKSSMASKNSALVSYQSDMSSIKAQAETGMQQLQDKIAELQKQLLEEKDKNRSVSTDLFDCRQRLNNMNDRERMVIQKIKELINKVKLLVDSKLSYNMPVLVGTDELMNNLTNLDVYLTQKGDYLDKMIGDLRNELSIKQQDLQSEITRLSSKSGQSNKAYQELEIELANVQNDIRNKDATINALRAQIATLEANGQNVSELRQKHLELERANNKIVELERINKEQEKRLRNIVQLETELRSIGQQLNECQGKLAGKEAQIQGFETKIKELELELKNSKQSVNDDTNRLTTELRQCNEELMRLKNEVKELLMTRLAGYFDAIINGQDNITIETNLANLKEGLAKLGQYVGVDSTQLQNNLDQVQSKNKAIKPKLWQTYKNLEEITETIENHPRLTKSMANLVNNLSKIEETAFNNMKIKEQIEAINNRIKILQDELGLLNINLGSLSSRGSFSRELEALASDLDKKRGASAARVRKNYEEAKEEEVKRAREQLESQIKTLTDEKEQLSRELQENKIKLVEVQHQCGLKDTEINSLDNLNQTYKTSIEQLEREKSELEKKYNDEVSKYKATEKQLSEENERLKNEPKFPPGFFDLLNQILTKLKQQYQVVTNESQVTGALNHILYQIESLRREKDTVDQTVSRLEGEKAELEKELSKTKTGLEEELRKARQEAVERSQQLNQIEDLIKTHGNNIAFQATDTVGRMGELIVNITKVQGQQNALQLQLDQCQADLTRCQEENQRLRDEKASVEQELSEVKGRISNLETELEKYKAENQKWQNQCAENLSLLEKAYKDIKNLPDFWKPLPSGLEKTKEDNIISIKRLIDEYEKNAKDKINCDTAVNATGLGNWLYQMGRLHTQAQLADIAVKAALSRPIAPLPVVTVGAVDRCDSELSKLESTFNSLKNVSNLLSMIRYTLRNRVKPYELKNPDEFRKLLSYLSRYTSDMSFDDVVKAYESLGTNVKITVNQNTITGYKTQIKNYTFNPDGTLKSGNASDYKQLCDSIKTDLRALTDIAANTGIDILFNDLENISGVVRIYVRVNDFDLNANNEIVVYNSGAPGVCNDFVTVESKVLPDELGGKTKYGPFYGVFQCFSNQDIIDGWTKTENSLCSKPYGQKECHYTKDGVKGMIHALKQILNGYNISIFVYGYSGTGKSYTLQGSNTDSGIVQLGLSAPEISSQIASIRITSIRELYGTGSMVMAKNAKSMPINDYPVRRFLPNITGQSGLGDSVADLAYYFKVLKDSENAIVPNSKGVMVQVSDIFTFDNNEIRFKKPDSESIFTGLKFIYNRLTLQRLINGRIKATPNNPESSRGHLFIKFDIDTDKGVNGSLTVCDMGGIEDVDSIASSIFGFNHSDAMKLAGATHGPDPTVFITAIKNNYQMEGKSNTDLIKEKRIFLRENITINDLYNKYRNYAAKDINTLTQLTVEEIMDLFVISMRLNPMDEKKNIDGRKKMDGNSTNSNNLEKFAREYGIDSGFVTNALVNLQKYFKDPKAEDKFIIYVFDYIRSIFKEGFYINESLNHIKAFFLNQKSEWLGNTLVAEDYRRMKEPGYVDKLKDPNYKSPLKDLTKSEDILVPVEKGKPTTTFPRFRDLFQYLNVNVISDKQPGGENPVLNYRPDSDFYSKDRYFYYPIFSQSVMNSDRTELLQTPQGKPLPGKWYFSSGYNSELKSALMPNITSVAQFPGVYADAPDGFASQGFKTNMQLDAGKAADPIGMILFLQEIALTNSPKKPSKFIMLALVKPQPGDNVDKNKYVNGAIRTLEFAEDVASTTTTITPDRANRLRAREADAIKRAKSTK